MPDVQITRGAGAPTPGYLAEPVATSDRPGPWPGVALVHDIIGMSDDLRLQAGWPPPGTSR